MREIRTHGSEGGAGQTNAPFLPLSNEYDFENSHLIKLWRSPDLKTWSEVGEVWDIDRHKNAGEWNWQSYWRTPMEATYRPPVRGVVAPELHYLKQNYALTRRGAEFVRKLSAEPCNKEG